MFYNYQSKKHRYSFELGNSISLRGIIDGKYLQWAKPTTHYSNIDSESNQKSSQKKP